MLHVHVVYRCPSDFILIVRMLGHNSKLTEETGRLIMNLFRKINEFIVVLVVLQSSNFKTLMIFSNSIFFFGGGKP